MALILPRAPSKYLVGASTVLNRIRNGNPALLDVIRNLDTAFPLKFSKSIDGLLNSPSISSPAPGSSEIRSGSNLTLAASSAAQSQVSASKGLQKKKSGEKKRLFSEKPLHFLSIRSSSSGTTCRTITQYTDHRK
ncbi:hypothetical protein DVH24_003291 [Malus domestica]|uniref:Uncharacterized protein n=1 Tax=Malus domestica TaxID=3750 RepID=A0A498INI9_MALDO|nr:hypothetical protein DVH24_003291 [Malus domestica]